MSNRNFAAYLEGKRNQYGAEFDASDLAPQFVKYFQSGERIKVEFTYGETTETLTGTVGVTTGWKPCFLLMLRSNSIGSVHTLGTNARVVAVKRGRKYVSC